MKKFFLIIWVFAGLNLSAQSNVSYYIDIGENNVSEGFFLKSAVTGQYQYDKYTLNSGFQFDIISNSDRKLTGFFINTAKELKVYNQNINWHIFYQWAGFSKLLRETNLGSFIKYKWGHFEILLGTNFRTYAFTKKALRLYEFDNGSPVKIHENWNFMYNCSWYLNPSCNKWNLGISLTDTDHFNISQETNPLLNLKGNYRLAHNLEIFSEAWYKTAGAFNLNVNYFGFFIRTGIKWHIV